MAVKLKPITYEASDGQDFDTEEEALAHDELITARLDYDKARAKFNQVLAKTQLTADGEPFDFGLFTSYYAVTDYYNQMPSLKRVSFLGWNFEISEHEDRVEISQNEGEIGRERRYSYPIKSLYADERRAKTALVNALHSWLEETHRTVADTIKDLRGK